ASQQFALSRFRFVFLLLRRVSFIDRGDYFLECVRNPLLLRSASCAPRLFAFRSRGSPPFVDRNLDGWRDTSLEDFDSEVVYLGKAGQQAHSALIFKRGPVDKPIL